MKTREVKAWLESNDIDERTISFYVARPDDDSTEPDVDPEFGTCDISGKKAMVAWCAAMLNNGEEFYFQASDELIGGALGKIAGAF